MHSAFDYIVININPIALQIGSITVRWYGLAYVLAIGIALMAILRYADALGVHRDHIWNIFIWTAIAGLIGGRLYYVIQQPNLVDGYLKQPGNIFAVWQGGMAFFGAIFLGGPTAAILAWRAGLSPWLTLDMGGLFAAVGQMFGRLGNLVNGDIVGYTVGHPTIPGTVCLNDPCIAYVANPHVLPWATAYINPGSFVVEHGVPYAPAAGYEIIINLVALAILWPLRLILPRQVRAGTFFCLYVTFYAIGQFLVFFSRSNVFVPFLGTTALKQAQWTAIFTFIVIVLFYFFVVRRFGQKWEHSMANPLPYTAANANVPASAVADVPVPPEKSQPRVISTPLKAKE